MPKNRSHQDRDGKRREIVEAAARRFAVNGFDGTSVAAIAAEAEITKNTVYWYFDDKDALLLAVVSAAFEQGQHRWQERRPDGLAERLEALVQTFDEIHPLTTALHARLESSAAVRAWHERFHAGGDRWLEAEITAHLAAQGIADPAAQLVASTVHLWTMAIEGMVTHQLIGADRTALCALLVAQLDAVARRAPEPGVAEDSPVPVGRDAAPR